MSMIRKVAKMTTIKVAAMLHVALK